MPCFHPLRAWQQPSGNVVLSKEPKDGTFLRLPCGNCLGCRKNKAQAWALRCQLEYQNSSAAVFATFTYDDEHLPLTLQKTHVSAYLKKLRKQFTNKLRFFASGEYGEHTQRPHYHAIIYGASQHTAPQLEKAWEQGHVKIDPATLANIAYTAGYCSKKIGYKRQQHQRLDTATGNTYQWQPPFILMSRNPGIGAQAKQYLNSWRLYAVKDGHKMPVPRYFHEHWKLHATMEEIEKRKDEIDGLNLTYLDEQQLQAAEKIAEKQQQLQGEKRKL